MDTEKLQQLWRTLKVDIVETREIRFTARTGEKKQNTETPRPFLIGFKNPAKRCEVLDNLVNLKNSEFQNISIVPDLTRRQREDDKSLREEAEKRNNELSEEDSGNFQWKVTGLKGSRTLVKASIARGTKKRGREEDTGNRPRTRLRTSSSQ